MQFEIKHFSLRTLPRLSFSFAVVLASVFSAASNASSCKSAAVQVARMAAPEYRNVFEVTSFDETPDLITYEITLSDDQASPKVTQTIETVLAKTTCSLIQDPLFK